MKNSKLKRLLSLFIAIVMLMAMTANSIVLADDDGNDAEEATQTPASIFDELREAVALIFGDLRLVELDDEAQEIALEDFDYLAKMILEVSPVQNIVERHLGISMKDLLALARQNILDKTPMPSLTFLYLGDDWVKEKQDPLDAATDYLMSLLTLVTASLGALGHLGPQDVYTLEQLFPTFVFVANNAEEMLEMGLTQGNLNMIQIQYDIVSAPAALKLYGLDPEDIDLEDESILDDAGFMDEDNLTAAIIEPGSVAYLHIASFMNNIMFDLETIYPFFCEIQDYEHLIIDIRGNGGGFVGYFPLLLMLLIEEPLEFQFPEFYLERELTAGYYEDPVSMMGGTLEGIFPAEEFVKKQGMEYFNENDLAFLDSVLLWQIGFEPITDLSVAFGGDIWLLVDELSMSASVVAAMISANTGFATVAGETTSGVSGVTYTYAALPNTGILYRIDLGYTVDNYGRSYEEFGVIPQIFNMPGLDALETVLTFISAPETELKTPVYLDGEDTGVSGVILDGTTLIPVSYVCDIFETAELFVDSYNWQVYLSYGDTEMILVINSDEAYIGDVSFTMPLPLQIVNGEIFIPIRFIAETFGYDVDFIDGVVVIASN